VLGAAVQEPGTPVMVGPVEPSSTAPASPFYTHLIATADRLRIALGHLAAANRMRVDSPADSPAALPTVDSPLRALRTPLASPLAEPVLKRALASPAMKTLEKVCRRSSVEYPTIPTAALELCEPLMECDYPRTASLRQRCRDDQSSPPGVVAYVSVQRISHCGMGCPVCVQMVSSPVLVGLLDEQAEKAAKAGALTAEEEGVMASLGQVLDAPEVALLRASMTALPTTPSSPPRPTDLGTPTTAGTPHVSVRRLLLGLTDTGHMAPTTR
jgi:hypothetical protein